MQTNNSATIIYRTFSVIQFFLLSLFRLAFFAGAAIALYHYNENPVVTTIVAVICAIFFVVMGQDEIIVYSDGLKFSAGILFQILKPIKYYKIFEIKSIEIKGTYGTGDELVSTRYGGREKEFNKIHIELRDGRSEVIQTNIYIDKLKKAVEETTKLINNKNSHLE